MIEAAIAVLSLATLIFAIGWALCARKLNRTREAAVIMQIALDRSSAQRVECATDHSMVLADLYRANADANRLARCVHAYIKQMDEFSLKTSEEPCKLTAEREALSLHQKLVDSQNVQSPKTETPA